MATWFDNKTVLPPPDYSAHMNTSLTTSAIDAARYATMSNSVTAATAAPSTPVYKFTPEVTELATYLSLVTMSKITDTSKFIMTRALSSNEMVRQVFYIYDDGTDQHVIYARRGSNGEAFDYDRLHAAAARLALIASV